MLDLALEVVDRLVDAVDELEEGVGGVVDRTVEDSPAGTARRRRVRLMPSIGRQHRLRARLADRDDRVGVATMSSSRYVGAVPPLTATGCDEHREHVSAVALAGAASDAAAVARRLGEQLDASGVEGSRVTPEDLVPARVDEVGPLRRHGYRG